MDETQGEKEAQFWSAYERLMAKPQKPFPSSQIPTVSCFIPGNPYRPKREVLPQLVEEWA